MGQGTNSSRLLLLACCVVLAQCIGATAVAAAEGVITQAADSQRTGWYPNEAQLSPGAIQSAHFGRIFYRSIQGQGYAQPLVVGNVVLVATNDDWIYALDAQSGDVIWKRSVGTPIDSMRQVAGACPNPGPHIGVLGTPVVDAAAGIAYFVAKTYVSGAAGNAKFELHAVSVATGAEQPGFPVTIAGSAENIPGLTFDPDHHLQRPGLALVDGVVYAAFGGICDITPYQGWLFGVRADGTIVHAWATSAHGGSIWQSGGGIVSDGPGQLIVSTGNGSTSDGSGDPPPGPGHSPPDELAQSVVRVSAEAGGKLRATDFFSPWNNVELDSGDVDLGSSAPLALPAPWFGTPSIPHLLVQDGKEGYVYLLDRDNLGGMGQGPGGQDGVVQRLGPYPGVWSAMATWPGDGGYVYIPAVGHEGEAGPLLAFSYGVEAGGAPRLALAGESADTFAYGSGAPVVTSDGTSSGSGVLWMTWCAGERNCGDGQLRAYAADPSGGKLQPLWHSRIGVSNRFTPPGVGDGRVYVVTSDGHLVGYGPAPSLSADDASFGGTILGDERTAPVTVTASEAVTITAVTLDDPQFSVDRAGIELPLTLAAGQSMTIPVTYRPTDRGPASAELTIQTRTGKRAVVVSGDGLLAQLTASPAALDFGTVAPEAHATDQVALANAGDVPLTIASVEVTGAGFAVANVPSAGTVVQPGGVVIANVRFSAGAPGSYAGRLRVTTDHTTTDVSLAASIPAPAAQLDGAAFPTTVVGQTSTRIVALTVHQPLVVGAISTSPADFAAGAPSRALPAMLAAGESLSVPVRFTPTARGPIDGELSVSTSAGELRSVLSGRAVVAALHASAGALDLQTFAGGGVALGSVTLTASGEIPLTIASVHLPAAPFGASGVPAVGTTLAPGDAVTVNVTFQPLAAGHVADALELVTEAGPVRIELSGTATGAALVPAASQAPRMRALRIKPRRVHRSRARVLLTFRLSAPSTLLVRLLRCGRGRGRTQRCTPLAHARLVRRLRGHAGSNRVRLVLPALPRGQYRLVLTPSGAGGAGAEAGVPFRVV